MKPLRKLLAPLLLGLSAAVGSVGTWAAPITQLGFILDASGSVDPADYNLIRSGLNAALATLPTDGTIEITVTSFSTGVATVVSPTILTAATLAGIQSAITTHGKSGGVTSTGLALTSTTDLMTASGSFALADTKSLINLLTDGVPCCDTNSNALATAGAAYAAAEGIDALSIEAIGSGVNSGSALALMQSLAFPGPATILATNQTVGIPNPLGGSWVIPVSDFSALQPVLIAKVQASVAQIPEPATLALLSVGLLGFGLSASRRRTAA